MKVRNISGDVERNYDKYIQKETENKTVMLCYSADPHTTTTTKKNIKKEIKLFSRKVKKKKKSYSLINKVAI